MEGINVSFGIGAFPFTMLGGVSLCAVDLSNPVKLLSRVILYINTHHRRRVHYYVQCILFSISLFSLPLDNSSSNKVCSHSPPPSLPLSNTPIMPIAAPRGAGVGNPPRRGEEQTVARVFITVALLVLVLIIFS